MALAAMINYLRTRNNKLRALFSIIVLIFTVQWAAATHNRAGEITYRHLYGYTYEITITTCTKTSVLADREWLKIAWGDNLNPLAELDSIQRDNIEFSPPGEDWQINTYTDVHTYPGIGSYLLAVGDQNRNDGVNNIPNSVYTWFWIESLLVISPLGFNNSVTLLKAPKEQACLNEFWIHNPGAFDPDGDSLYYSLIPCMEEGGVVIAGYQFPDLTTANPSDVFSINSTTGDVTWDVASLPAGEYNFAIKIEEFRNGFLMGYVVRDMQINVITCNNSPPEIADILDVCIEVGQNFTVDVEVTDPEGNGFTLEAVGGPLTEVVNAATFNEATGVFNWTPGCEEVRPQPYQVLFVAEDFGNQINLVDIETVLITVVAPEVENPNAEPDGNSILLNWDVTPCLDAVARPELGSYKIYRRNNLYGFDPLPCELGVPAYTGYQLIGEVDGLENTTYVDDFQLGYGGTYCYMVVTCFPNGAISYASEEFCTELIKDVPVMTNVSVNITDPVLGENYVAWSPPTELDLVTFPGPYHYELYQASGYTGASQLIYTTPVEADLMLADTTFVHTGLNTRDNPNNYRVVFFSEGEAVSQSTTASSIFLEMESNDNQLRLFWTELVPWFNETFEVFRYDEVAEEFISIGTTSEYEFLDTGLDNNREYCYYVVGTGSFNVDDIIDPVINFSQRACGIPFDFTAPCPPVLTIEPDCEAEVAYLSWTNPNESCADDVTSYNLYYAPTIGGDFELIEQFNSDEQTSFTYNLGVEGGSIAGCYVITALDSLLPGPGGVPNQNESEWGLEVCIDNCPFYFLPNVFSPNNDGVNDFFRPFPYKFVESVDCKIFNRWGGLVFETADADINWDGTSNDSGEVVSDGVYYYTIVINSIRLSGIEPIEVSGNITVLGGDKNNKITE
jgi:gliding motility-associated-like protein